MTRGADGCSETSRDSPREAHIPTNFQNPRPHRGSGNLQFFAKGPAASRGGRGLGSRFLRWVLCSAGEMSSGFAFTE